MTYTMKPLTCDPARIKGMSERLILSHYENNYGGALRRLNAITEQLESLDFAKTPGYVINGLKREELVALNSTLLHELYFASMGGDGQPTKGMTEVLARDFGSLCSPRPSKNSSCRIIEFIAMSCSRLRPLIRNCWERPP